MIRLHDYVLSADCYAARLMLALLDVPHQTVAVEVYPRRDQDTPAFRALSPDGVLPVLGDGDAVLIGVPVILLHIAAHHDPARTWLPAGARDVERWVSFATSDLTVLETLRLSVVMGGSGDHGALRRVARAALRRLEDHLIEQGFEGRHWIAGDAPTIADVAAFPHVALCHDSGIGLEDYPALNLWQRRVRALPGFIGMPGIPDYC